MRVKKKILFYSAVTFFLTLIIVFFVFEFRFVKKIISENETNITRVVSGELNVYLHGLRYRTDQAAALMGPGDGAGDRSTLRELAARNPDITEIYLLDDRGGVLASLSGAEVGAFKSAPDAPAGVIKDHQVVGLALAAPLGGGPGDLMIVYGTSDFQNEFLLKYVTDTFKVSILDRDGRPLVWPFGPDVLSAFDPAGDTVKVEDTVYRLHRSPLENFPFTVVFMEPDSNFDTYRILTIMFLVFALYFLIYHFIIEVLQSSSVDHYFDNIDFNIFNNLKEGIIIANKFGKVVFANKTVYEMFAEKRIVLRETDLQEITGPIDGPRRVILQKSGDLLEIIRSPLVKNGKPLGSLVVISPSWEKEKLYEHVLGGLVELLPDGVLFVNKEGRVVAFNLMASYFLGHLAQDMKISAVNAELADLIEGNIGATASTRAELSRGYMHCELKPVYDENRLYAGTIVFIKTS